MLFNSISFLIFLPIVYLLYWFVFNKSLKIQNVLLLVASYYFYSSWDWRFLSLLIISTVADYSIGLFLEKEKNPVKRKALLTVSLIINLCFLGFFKYYNFFINSFIDLFKHFNIALNITTLSIILPVGISFYTFQSLSYIIDIYRKKTTATRSLLDYAVFVGFFPQLVAGPIMRVNMLLPQFEKKRQFDYSKAVEGLKIMLFGFFKKIVIADTCAIYVNEIFSNYSQYSGSAIMLGAFYFTIQIYCDFSGYSEIAAGTANLFGIDLIRNFNFPYFSSSIREFWHRWHISLSNWFKDYVYISLGGNRAGKARRAFNIISTFVLSGLWHGANFKFIFWGFINGIYYIPSIIFSEIKMPKPFFSKVSRYLKTAFIFFLTCLTFIFFRADNLTIAFKMIHRLFHTELVSIPQYYYTGLLYAIPLLIFEWFRKKDIYPLVNLNWPKYLRRGLYYLLLILVIVKFNQGTSFIYFQF